MSGKTKNLSIYIAYALFNATLYGLFSYFVLYRALSGGVMLYSYLLNIAAIILLLLLDKFVNDILLSKEFIITKQNYVITSVVHGISLISFRTVLYLFYIVILVVSRVSVLEPSLVNPDFQNFVLSIEYCLILLVVFDKFFEYLLKDNERIKMISGKFTGFAKFVNNKRKKRRNKNKHRRL